MSKRFDGFQAVKNIDLALHYGEILGLIGANGAGKTTTIKMLCGLQLPTTGKVLIGGERSDSNAKEVRRQIGYMSQRFSLYDGLTVLENLEFYSTIYDIPPSRRKEKIEWALHACDLTGMENYLVEGLPRGWKQRIAFGTAVMHEPSILILDEPTAGVDPLARRHLWTMIRRFVKDGAAILVTTHYLDEVEYCDKLYLMTEGEIVAQGTPEEIANSQGGELFEIHLSDTSKAYAVLRNRMDTWRISTIDNVLHVFLENPPQDLPKVERILQEENIAIKSIERIDTSLEDAVISIVQNSARSRK